MRTIETRKISDGNFCAQKFDLNRIFRVKEISLDVEKERQKEAIKKIKPPLGITYQ